MTEIEKSDWLELCEYIKKNLLCYTPEMKFPNYLALRLKGLSEGKFMANKKTKPNGHYTFKEIYLTSKICKSKILKYFSNNEAKINDEKHKINLIMMFIEQEINDVVLRLNKQKQANQSINQVDFSNYENSKAEYKINGVEDNKKYDDLW